MYNRCVSRSAPRYTTMTHYSWSSRRAARARIDRRTTCSRLFTDAKNFKCTRSVSLSSNTDNMRLGRSDSGLQLCTATKKDFATTYVTARKCFTYNLSNMHVKLKFDGIFSYKELSCITRCKDIFLLAQSDHFLSEKVDGILGHFCNQNSNETVDFNKPRISSCLFTVNRSIMIFNLSMSLMRACVCVRV